MRSYAARLAARAVHELPHQKLSDSTTVYAQAAHVMRRALLRYVETWCEAKPSFKEWIKRNPDLYKKVAKAAQQTRFELLPTVRAGAILSRKSPSVTASGVTAIAEYDAAWLFIDLLIRSSEYDVGRCGRCKGYYLNFSGHRNKVFCSRRCATTMSAERAMRERRMREKDEKLARAAELCTIWKPGRSKDWKRWVAHRSGLTTNWLTRALNRGELQPPRLSR